MESTNLPKGPKSLQKTRERVMLQLLNSKKYVFNTPIDTIVTGSIICHFIETGDLPISNSSGGKLLIEEAVLDVAKRIHKERNQPISTTNNYTPPNKSLFKKIFG